MAQTQEIICKCGCGRKKEVRTADIKRGWGLYFSKSCKAKVQEKRTGQYKAYLRGNCSSFGSMSVNESDENTNFTESVVRSNRLKCNQCSCNIKQGSKAVFEITNDSKMVNVFCHKCGDDYTHELIMDSVHPFSSEALGQW